MLVGTRIVPDAKIARYLLNPDHPIGRDKARLFASFGFDRESPTVLAAALLRHSDEKPIYRERHHRFGVNRELRCEIVTPDLRNPCIVVVWFQADGETGHRLVTAYPVE